MAKRSRKQQNKKFNQNLIWMGGLVTLIVVALGAFIFLDNEPATTADGIPIVNEKISPDEYNDDFETPGDDHLLIDVRTPEEFAAGHIEGAINIPVESIAMRLDEIPEDEKVVLYCRSGNRSNQAAAILDDAGYPQIYDLGGIIDWTAEGYALVQ